MIRKDWKRAQPVPAPVATTSRRKLRIALFASPILPLAAGAVLLLGDGSSNRDAGVAIAGALVRSIAPRAVVKAGDARDARRGAGIAPEATKAGATARKPTEQATFGGAPGRAARSNDETADRANASGAAAAAARKALDAKLAAIKSDADKLAAEVRKIREDLRSPDPKVRLAALVEARALDDPELFQDVQIEAARETDVACKRVATQVLALGDPQSCADLLTTLRKDPDPVVQLNASFGLARAGNESEQAYLLLMCDASRSTAPKLLPIVANALEDPAIRSPVVIARFQQVVDDPSVPQATRDHAAQVIKTKLGNKGS